jgi:thiol-disulfide isomerase/thioredoxin
VAREQIAVFSGDGGDPAPDLATREGEPAPEFWLLPESVARSLRPPISYVDSRIDGVDLRPAGEAALESWFDQEGSRLGPGDTLLLYVTDHGERGGDPAESRITLWGEELGVTGLRRLLAVLDRGVQVVMLMSQCYSGGFADAALAEGSGRVCGYFSTEADRKAHGCYAEVSREELSGHSHRLFTALGAGHALPAAQQEVLVSDDTPDVPRVTSGLFLERRLEQAAAKTRLGLPAFVDPLLAEAFAQPQGVEREIRLLDRIGRAFGFASPRSLSRLDEQARELSELAERLDSFEKLWREALEALRRENLQAFRAVQPEWGSRLAPEALAALDADARRRTSDEVLGALVRFTEGARERDARLRDLRWKAEEAADASYRAEVRLGVVLRMRALLLELAGRRHLARAASKQDRDAHARLVACEDLSLGEQAREPVAFSPEPFPPLAAERRRLARLQPGWLGIRYRPPSQSERSRHALAPGASVVSAVLPDGPAQEAGLQVGDILLGPPSAPFAEPDAVREWTMQGTIGRSQPLRLLRDGEEQEVSIRLAAYPLELPALPGPPEVGSIAPALGAVLSAEVAPLPPGKPRLYFFWATWCGYCKRALPELAAFSSQRDVPVVAITDEDPEDVTEFVRQHPGPLPERIATDRRRELFERYGVSGTPTFVLVDERGVVRHVQTGYDARKGIGIAGWRWDGKAE